MSHRRTARVKKNTEEGGINPSVIIRLSEIQHGNVEKLAIGFLRLV